MGAPSFYPEMHRLGYEVLMGFSNWIDEANVNVNHFQSTLDQVKDLQGGAASKQRTLMRFEIPASRDLGPSARVIGLGLWIRTKQPNGVGAGGKALLVRLNGDKHWTLKDSTWNNYASLATEVWAAAGGDMGQSMDDNSSIDPTAQVPGGSGGAWYFIDLSEVVSKTGAGAGSLVEIELLWDDETTNTHKLAFYGEWNITDAATAGWPAGAPSWFLNTDFYKPVLDVTYEDVAPEMVEDFTAAPHPDDPTIPVFSWKPNADKDFQRLHIRFSTTPGVLGSATAATLKGWGTGGVTKQSEKSAILEAAGSFFNLGAPPENDTYYFRPFVEDFNAVGPYADGGAEIPITRPSTITTAGQNAANLIKYNALLSTSAPTPNEKLVVAFASKGDLLENEKVGARGLQIWVQWMDGTVTKYRPRYSTIRGTMTAPRLTLDVKDGSQFRVGDAVLAFNGTNYDVMRVEAVDGDTLSINTDRSGGGNDKKTFYSFADGDPIYTLPIHVYRQEKTPVARARVLNSQGWASYYTGLSQFGFDSAGQVPVAVIDANVKTVLNSPWLGRTEKVRFSAVRSYSMRADAPIDQYQWSIHHGAGAEAVDTTTTVPYLEHEHTTGGSACDVAVKVRNAAGGVSGWVHAKAGGLPVDSSAAFLDVLNDFVDPVQTRPEVPEVLASSQTGADTDDAYRVGKGRGRRLITYRVKAATPSSSPPVAGVPQDLRTFLAAVVANKPVGDLLPYSTGSQYYYGTLESIDRINPYSKGKYEIVFTVSYPPSD